MNKHPYDVLLARRMTMSEKELVDTYLQLEELRKYVFLLRKVSVSFAYDLNYEALYNVLHNDLPKALFG